MCWDTGILDPGLFKFGARNNRTSYGTSSGMTLQVKSRSKSPAVTQRDLINLVNYYETGRCKNIVC